MTINGTLAGQLLVLFALIMGVACYCVARGKVSHPGLAGLLGVVLSIIPVFSLIYLGVLVFKKERVLAQ